VVSIPKVVRLILSLENRFDAARLVANVELPNLPTFENNKQQKNDTKMNEKLSLLDKATNFLASLLNIEKGEAETKAAELLNVLDIKKDAEKVSDFQNVVTAFESRLAVLETKLTNQVTLETIETKISDSKNVVDFDNLVNDATDKINTNLATALVDFEKDLTEKAATLHLELTNKIIESSDNGDFKAPKKVLTNTAYENLVNRFAPKN
jgi:hypothetical protein